MKAERIIGSPLYEKVYSALKMAAKDLNGGEYKHLIEHAIMPFVLGTIHRHEALPAASPDALRVRELIAKWREEAKHRAEESTEINRRLQAGEIVNIPTIAWTVNSSQCTYADELEAALAASSRASAPNKHEPVSDELMLMAKEFLNSDKWKQALTHGNDFTMQQHAIAEFGEEVLRIERARVQAGSVSQRVSVEVANLLRDKEARILELEEKLANHKEETP